MAPSPHDRPLSPHVGIYRWQITNGLSILHRITGFGLSFGALGLAVWLWALAYDAELFGRIQECLGSLCGKLVLFGFTVAFFYHFANGLRHLNWDTGRGFLLSEATDSGRLVLAFTVSMTALTWLILWDRGLL